MIYWFPNTHLQPRPVTYAHLIKCLKLLMGRSNEHLYWRLYQLSTAEWQTVPKCSGLKNNHDFICHFCQFQLLQISSTLIQTPFTSHFSIRTVSCWAPFSYLAPFRSILHTSTQWTFQKFKQGLMALLFKTQYHLVALSISQHCMLWGLKDTYHSFIFPLPSCHLPIEKKTPFSYLNLPSSHN